MSSRRTTASRLAAILLLVIACSTSAQASVKGRAYGIYANLCSYGVALGTHCDSGWLNSSSGGSRSSYKSNVSYGNTLRCDYMESESHGDRCKGHSGSRLESGWILKGSPFEVTWTHMESADEDTCCKSSDNDYRASVFEGLTFAGQPVVVTGKPNQTIYVAGATLILNERKKDSSDLDCDDDDYEHRSLHLILRNGNEVILCASKFDSDDDCCIATQTNHSTWGEVKAHYR